MKDGILNLLRSIPDYEEPETLRLFERLEENSIDLSKEVALKILHWKSPRPSKYYKLNSDVEIKEVTKLAFSTENDKLKIHILTSLIGVNYPAASALLMFHNPRRYPVLDIRVWQQLYYEKLVNTNPKGQSFTLNQWEDYLKIIRELAYELGISARQVEKRLFDYDKKIRTSNLYL